MLMFKEHLVKTHGITCRDLVQKTYEQLEYDSYTEPVEEPPEPSPPPPPVERSPGEASSSAKGRKAQAPAEPPAEEPLNWVESRWRQLRMPRQLCRWVIDNVENLGAACRTLGVTINDAANKLNSATAALSTLIDKPGD